MRAASRKEVLSGRKYCNACEQYRPLSAFSGVGRNRCMECSRKLASLANAGRSVLGKPLTDKQHRVADMMCMGLANEEIAERLGLHRGTVRNHVKAIIRHVGAEGNYSGARVRAAVLYTEKKLKGHG